MENEKDKVNYEISCLVKEEAAMENVSRLLSQHGAESVSAGQVKKIVLAYKIGKDTHAFFGYFHFKALPAAVKSLEQDLSRHNAVIRFLIIKNPEYNKNKQEAVPREHEAIKTKPVVAPAPLSNEALEKTLEEISK